MISEALLTPYAEKMDKSSPWTEYPRPSLVRDSYISLNGIWDFGVTNGEDGEKYSCKILVPFPPESRLSGYNEEIAEGALMHYRRNFIIPHGFNKGKVILHLGAVDERCSVSVNGNVACCHEGGYLPFSSDITEYISEGENTIEIVASDDLSHKYPYGKQKRQRGGMWYTPVSGIWQSVWLESVPESYVEGIKITPTCKRVKIEVIGGDEHKRLTLDACKKVYEWSGACHEITIDEPVLWTPDTPHLYYFTLECGEDTVRSYFALRTVECADVNGVPRILLNGKPYLFTGLLDQGYYPDGIYLPATSDGYRDDILLAKSLGFNMLRKHIKIEPDIFYYLCDSLGMAVFQDMVNNSDYSFIRDTALPFLGITALSDKRWHNNAETRRIFKEHSVSTVKHLYSHPCIVYYTIFNEGWGQFSADEMYTLIKEKDPTRIIDSTSGWFTQKLSDVDSRHVYFKPIRLGKRSERPLVISEFGGYSHRVTGHLFGEGNFGYRQFSDREELWSMIEKLYTDEVLPLISKGICALVYTQISDVEDETNGLVTYDRRVVKVDRERMHSLMLRLRESINATND